MTETFYFKKVGNFPLKVKSGPISAGMKYYRFGLYVGIIVSTVDYDIMKGNHFLCRRSCQSAGDLH
jgi:hypothetical protein